jgi:hypothetical protein
MIGNAPVAIIGHHKISTKMVQRNGYIVDPSSYRDFRIFTMKEQAI